MIQDAICDENIQERKKDEAEQLPLHCLTVLAAIPGSLLPPSLLLSKDFQTSGVF